MKKFTFKNFSGVSEGAAVINSGMSYGNNTEDESSELDFSNPRFTWYKKGNQYMALFHGWGMVFEDGKFKFLDGHFDSGEPGRRGYERCSNPGIDPSSSEEGMRKLREMVPDKYFSESREKVSQEQLDKVATEGVVQMKPNGKWGIISEEAGEWWNANYESKESAENALKAYHVNKTFSAFKNKSFGNPLADLPQALDSKLMDFAQDTHGAISYTDVFKYADNFQSSKSNAKLNRLLNNWHKKLDEGDEEKANDISDKIIKIIKGMDSQKSFSLVPLKNGSFESNPTEMLPGDNVPGVADLIGTLMFSVTYAHLYHICTAEYPAHIALQEYYEEMPDLVDALAEATIGNHNGLTYRCVVSPKEAEDAVSYFNRLLELVLAVQEITSQADQIYQPYIDSIKEQLESTLYKLKRLSCGNKVFSCK